MIVESLIHTDWNRYVGMATGILKPAAGQRFEEPSEACGVYEDRLLSCHLWAVIPHMHTSISFVPQRMLCV
jgi:hypothetical protein